MRTAEGADTPQVETDRGLRESCGSAGQQLPTRARRAPALAIWIYGGRAGWASGMFVTPPRRSTRSSATRASLLPSVEGHLVGLPWPPHRGIAGVRRRSSPLACRSCAAASPRLAAIANAAPWVAVAPCLIIILGESLGPTAVAALAVFFYVFISTTVGLSAAPVAVHDVASVLGASRFQRMWLVQLPAAWPSMSRTGSWPPPATLAGAIFGEWYRAPRGLGVLLITAMQSARRNSCGRRRAQRHHRPARPRCSPAAEWRSPAVRLDDRRARPSSPSSRAAVIIAEVIAFAALAVVLVTI